MVEPGSDDNEDIVQRGPGRVGIGPTSFLMDEDTEELMVRSFLRNDGAWRSYKTRLCAQPHNLIRSCPPRLQATARHGGRSTAARFNRFLGPR